jgi:dihydroorotate dehydrogenase electron transfer subunit
VSQHEIHKEYGALIPLRARTARPDPTWDRAPIVAHTAAEGRYRRLVLHAPTIAAIAQPGQFVMLTIPGDDDRDESQHHVLPRPMAIYRSDAREGTIEILYGVVGNGTRALAGTRSPAKVLVVGPLGQGFSVEPHATRVLLVGRGIGTCSLTTVAAHNAACGRSTVAVTSAGTRRTLIGVALYREFGVKRLYEVSDDEGTSDPAQLRARLESDLDGDPPQQIFTCGSDRLAALCATLGKRWGAGVQVSLEAHMACGLGYCHGCASGTPGGGGESPLVCVDGPVFELDEAAQLHATAQA